MLWQESKIVCLSSSTVEPVELKSGGALTKKSKLFKSGDLGGQDWDQPPPIQRFGNA